MKTVALGALASVAAWAQCSMCRTAAAAQGPAAARTLDTAVLILLVPAVLMFCGIFAGVIRNSPDNDE